MREMVWPYTPNWRLMVRDLSWACSAELLAKAGGAVYEVWLFDERARTFICSATPSAECWFIGVVPKETPEDKDAAEALDEILRDAWSETPESDYFESGYFYHAAACEGSLPAHSGPKRAVMDEEEYIDDREDMLESLRGNAGAERAVDAYLKLKEQK